MSMNLKLNIPSQIIYSDIKYCTSQIEASTSPSRAYPGHLTPLPAWDGGNLMNLVFPGRDIDRDASLMESKFGRLPKIGKNMSVRCMLFTFVCFNWDIWRGVTNRSKSMIEKLIDILILLDIIRY